MRITNQTFRNDQIRLEFVEFENCSFENCTLVYGGYGPISLVGCSFINVHWVFADAARNTILFMQAMYQHGGGGRELIERTLENIRQGSSLGVSGVSTG